MQQKPTAVIFAWLFARAKHVRKYVDLYERRGIQTRVVYPNAAHVLRPSLALADMQSLLDKLESPLLLHVFSVGGYMSGMLLRAAQEARNSNIGNSNNKNDVELDLSALVVDSPVDFNGVPDGIARAAAPGNVLAQSMIRNCVHAYRSLFARVTVEHKRSSDLFHEAPALLSDKSHSLWFYSRDDPIADAERCDVVFNKWQRHNGHRAERIVFDQSNHVGHLRKHTERYESALDSLIDRWLNDYQTR
jgi:Eukaryotic protein of unknown function (DUF829)